MKNTTCFLLKLLAITMIVGLASSAAMALCNPGKAFGDRANNFCDYTWIQFSDGQPSCGPIGGAGAPCSGVIGRFWQTNNFGGVNNGTWDATQWVNSYGANYWFFQDNTMGDPGVVGCPSDCFTVYIENTNTDEFILWTAAEGTGPACDGGRFDFNFTDVLPGTVGKAPGASPRPRVDSLGRAGTDLNVTFTVPDPTAGVVTEANTCGTDGAITNLIVYSQLSDGAPSTDIAGWTQEATLAATGGSTSITIGCPAAPTTQDQWIATGLEINSQAPQFVSAPTALECDPNLADPKRKWKQIDRDDSGHVKPRKM